MQFNSLDNSRRYAATLGYLDQVRTRFADRTGKEYTPELALVDELLVTLTESDAPAAVRDVGQKVFVPLAQQNPLSRKIDRETMVIEHESVCNQGRFLKAYSSVGAVAGLQAAALATSGSALSPSLLSSLGWSQIQAALPLLESIPRLREIALATGLQLAQVPLMVVSILATPLAYVRGAAIVRSAHQGGDAERRLELLEEVERSRQAGAAVPDLESIRKILGHKPASPVEPGQQVKELLSSLQDQRKLERRDSGEAYTPTLREIDRLSSQLRARPERSLDCLERNIRGEMRRADALANLHFLAAGAVTAGNVAATILLPGATILSTILSQTLAGFCGAGVAEWSSRQEKSEALLEQVKMAKARLCQSAAKLS